VSGAVVYVLTETPQADEVFGSHFSSSASSSTRQIDSRPLRHTQLSDKASRARMTL